MNAESNLSERVLAEQERLFVAGSLLGTMSGPRPPFPRRKPLTEQYPQRNRAERRMAAKLARREQAKVA